MKTKDKQELHAKTKEELQTMLEEARKALFTLKFDRAQRKLKNTRSIFEKRKDIAKIATVLKEKELFATGQK